MENSTPFDLNDAIQRWRANLAASPAYRPADLEELESHVRDSMATLQTNGLSPQEAFWVAIHRLGNPEALVCEFSKVNLEQVWLNRALWMVTGFFSIGALLTLTYALAGLVTITAHAFIREGSLLGLLSLLVYTLFVPTLLFALWRLARRNGSFISRVAPWAKDHPIAVGVSVFLFLAATFMIPFVLNGLAARSMPMQTFGVVMQWRLYQAAFPIFLWPILVSWLLMRSRKICT